MINLKYIYINTCDILEKLLTNINGNNNIDGIFVTVRDLQVNYNGALIPLDEYLQKLENFKKKVILNIVPINNTSKDIISIQRENRSYVNDIKEITDKYSNINFWYTSTNTRILYFLEEFFKSRCCGYYLSDDLNYVDTCFYIFPLNKYNKEIITQELERDKYIYFIVNNSDDLNILHKLLVKDFSEWMNSLTIITCNFKTM